MSNSLTVHRLEKVCSEFKEGRTFSLDDQKCLNGWGNICKEASIPKPLIEFKFEDDYFRHYFVKTSSNLINEPIYLLWNDLENFVEYKRGYSSISEFQLLTDLDYKYIYIFAPKKIADRFVKMVQKEKKVEFSNIPFDFSRILELENLIVAWGIWENSSGAITKTARFGKDVTIEISEDEYSSITSMYIDYMYDGKTIQLILNSEGRISTQNKLKNKEMIIIYNELIDKLMSNTKIKNTKLRCSHNSTFDYFS